MSNVSIFEKKWIDLVFENRNKEYGAYQLRQENPKTMVMALLSALLFISLLSGMAFLLSSFGSKPIVETPTVIDEPLIIVDYTVPPTLPKNPEKVTPPETTAALSEPTIFTPLIIVKPTEVIDEVPTNVEITENPSVISGTEGGSGTSSIPSGTINGSGTDINLNSVDAGPSTISELDKLPEYPGGLNKFREYIGNNFEKPEIDNIAIVKVLMSFVIEKDGSMTEIKVLRNPGYGLDKEAIRVLKSLKTKWTPGIKDGKKVRTIYTLPIAVKME